MKAMDSLVFRIIRKNEKIKNSVTNYYWKIINKNDGLAYFSYGRFSVLSEITDGFWGFILETI